jgi:hypothetical protein
MIGLFHFRMIHPTIYNIQISNKGKTQQLFVVTDIFNNLWQGFNSIPYRFIDLGWPLFKIMGFEILVIVIFWHLAFDV